VLRELADSGSDCLQHCITPFQPFPFSQLSPVSVHVNETGLFEVTNWLSSRLSIERIKHPTVPTPSDTLFISIYCCVDITFHLYLIVNRFARRATLFLTSSITSTSVMQKLKRAKTSFVLYFLSSSTSSLISPLLSRSCTSEAVLEASARR
jgi:uncharacterized OsmC-like protein